MLLFALIYLLTINKCRANLMTPVEEVSEQLKEYLLTGIVSFDENHVTIAIVIYDEGRTSPIVSFFISHQLRFATIVANTAREFNEARMEKMRNIFCFVETFSNIKEALEYVKTKPSYKFDGKFSFIISTAVNNTTWLNDTLGYIWHWKILNFVVVFEIEGRMEIIGYNPFRNLILNYSDVYRRENVFPDKVANLMGYKLTCAMHWDRPRHRMVNGVLWGKDVNLFKEISRYINATPTISMLGSSAEVANAVGNNTANLSFNRQFAYLAYLRAKSLLNPCYLFQLEYMCVVVPTPGLIPQYLYLVEIFTSNLYFCILAALMFAIGFTHCFKQYSLGESASIIVQIFIYVPCQQLEEATRPLRFFLVTWVIFSMLLATGFNAKLLSFLVTPRYSSEITTLEELSRSKLQVGVDLQLNSIDFKIIQDKLVDVRVPVAIAKYNKDRAYILPSSYAEIIQRKRDASNRQIYKKLDQNLAAGHNAYIFEEHSPFIAKFEILLLRFWEFGLGNFGVEYLPSEVVQDYENVPLSLLHLQSAFYIVCFGLLLSLIGFGVELGYHQLLKRRIMLEF